MKPLFRARRLRLCRRVVPSATARHWKGKNSPQSTRGTPRLAEKTARRTRKSPDRFLSEVCQRCAVAERLCPDAVEAWVTAHAHGPLNAGTGPSSLGRSPAPPCRRCVQDIRVGYFWRRGRRRGHRLRRDGTASPSRSGQRLPSALTNVHWSQSRAHTKRLTGAERYHARPATCRLVRGFFSAFSSCRSVSLRPVPVSRSPLLRQSKRGRCRA